jgi:small-conductance mechanosensitive channel
MLEPLIAELEKWPLLENIVLNNSLARYTVAVAVFLTTYLLSYLLSKILASWLEKFVSRTKNKLDDVIWRILEVLNAPFFLAISLYLATRLLSLTEFWELVVTRGMVIVAYVYLALGLQRALGSLLEAFTAEEDETKKKGRKLDRSTADFAKQFGGLILWIVIFLLSLQGFGYDITALLGGLGIAGIAIAFALQNVLSDIFAYFTINLDKPFKKGDFIIIGQDMGTVKNIGIKNTRIRTLQGQDLVMTNNELTNSRINNYAAMERRRVEFHLGVGYETSQEKLESLPKWIEEIIRAKEECTFDRAHLKEMAEYSLNFEVVYHLETPSYDTYMSINQDILLQIIRRLKAEKIELAYPTSQVRLAKT